MQLGFNASLEFNKKVHFFSHKESAHKLKLLRSIAVLKVSLNQQKANSTKISEAVARPTLTYLKHSGIVSNLERKKLYQTKKNMNIIN